MAFGMKHRSKSNGSKLPRKARVGLSLLHYTFGEPDAMEQVVKAKTKVGDTLVGSPEQVISTMPGMITAGVESNNPEFISILRSFGIDPALEEGRQDRQLVCKNVRDYLATL